MKDKIIDNPEQWIITRKGDFVRIKDSEISVEDNLTKIREHLKKPYKGSVRFQAKTSEQISKERYDKVWEEVNFDFKKFHDWLYDPKNKDKVEIIKLEGKDFSEAAEAIFNLIKNSKQKWRIRYLIRKKSTHDYKLVNEETGQVIYPDYVVNQIRELLDKDWESRYNGFSSDDETFSLFINNPSMSILKGKHTSSIIFLHGTYGAKGTFSEIEKIFPNTKFIYPHSPTLQYDMWHDSQPTPGGQCKGWINITGDAWEIMENDVCPNNSPINYEKADHSIHLDYPQLRRAADYVNEIIEKEIAAGIPPEKIFVAGYSQGGLLTLAVALTSRYKLGGFISLCGLLPRWDKLIKITQDKNKETPTLIINNTKDPWIPFWTGKKTYEILKNRGYNVEFKTHPGLGHSWKNEDVANFLEKQLSQETTNEEHRLAPNSEKNENSILSKNEPINPWILGTILIAGIGLFLLLERRKE